MANVLVEESSLQAIADTIRSKLGVSDTYLPSEMADAIDDIGGGITPTGTINITANGTYNVTNYASADVAVPTASGTKQVSITQNGTTTEDVAAYASAQITANVPNSYAQADEGKVVNNGALVSQSSDTVTDNGTYDTTLINSLVVDVASGGGDYLAQFLNNTLVSYESAEATKVHDRTFQMSSVLKNVSLPNCTVVNANGFAYDTALESVNLPSVTEIKNNAFDGCSKLGGVVLKACTKLGNNAFQGCSMLKYADVLGGENWNAGSVFNGCTIFDTFVIRCNSVQLLNNVNWFNNTCFKSGGTGGILYVPSALISAYQSATNWSTILGYANNQIKAIEGSTYETHYADGTVIA